MSQIYKDSIANVQGSRRIERGYLHIENKKYPIYEGLNSIGRSPNAVVNIKNINISQTHAIITVVNESQLYISDFKSSNGTNLNGIDMSPMVLYSLEDNATIVFAQTEGVFRLLASDNYDCDIAGADNAATQDVTQNFYKINTQIIDHSYRDLDIHEMNTQVETSCFSKTSINEKPTQLFALNNNTTTNISTAGNEDSNSSTNDSIDLATMKKIVDNQNLPAGPSKSAEENNLSQVSDQPKVARRSKVSVFDSDDDTDIEDDVITRPKSSKIQKPNPLDSDTDDIDETTPAKLDKNVSIVDDGEKPGPCMEKLHSEKKADSVIEEEDNAKADLNDTDVIPCTQDVTESVVINETIFENTVQQISDDELHDNVRGGSFREEQKGGNDGEPAIESHSVDHSYATNEGGIQSGEGSVIDWFIESHPIAQSTTTEERIEPQSSPIEDTLEEITNKHGDLGTHNDNDVDDATPDLVNPDKCVEVEDSYNGNEQDDDFYQNPTQLLPTTSNTKDDEDVDEFYIQPTQAVFGIDKRLDDGELCVIPKQSPDKPHTVESNGKDDCLSSHRVFLHPESPNRRLKTPVKSRSLDVVEDTPDARIPPRSHNASRSLEDDLERMFASQHVATQHLVEILEGNDDPSTEQKKLRSGKKRKSTEKDSTRKISKVSFYDDDLSDSESTENPMKGLEESRSVSEEIKAIQELPSGSGMKSDLKSKNPPMNVLGKESEEKTRASSRKRYIADSACNSKSKMAKNFKEDDEDNNEDGQSKKKQFEPKPGTNRLPDSDDDDFVESPPKFALPLKQQPLATAIIKKGRKSLRKADLSKSILDQSHDCEDTVNSMSRSETSGVENKITTRTRQSKAALDLHKKIKVTATVMPTIAEVKKPTAPKRVPKPRDKIEIDTVSVSSSDSSENGRVRRLSANSRRMKTQNGTKKKTGNPEEPKTRKSPRNSNDSIAATPERTKRVNPLLKPKVVFTLMTGPELEVLESLIRKLGGRVVESVDACTVLVTGSVKRTCKLLTAVGQGKPICSPGWLNECKKVSRFLDPWDFILVDPEAEDTWDFSLRASLERASTEKLFEEYTFQNLSTTSIDVLKGAIESCGGKLITRGPSKKINKFVIIATPKQKVKFTRILKTHPDAIVVEPEAIFDGTLRQEIRFENHLIHRSDH